MKIAKWVEVITPVKRRTSSRWMFPALVGLGVGIAAGVGIGLLYAPDTGEETRLRLREGAFRVKERARLLADRAKHRVTPAIEQAQQSVSS